MTASSGAVTCRRLNKTEGITIMAKRNDTNVVKVKNTEILVWLDTCLRYLKASCEESFPVEMEPIRDNMMNALKTWVEDFMKNVPIEKSARRVEIIRSSNNFPYGDCSTSILIIWYRSGLIKYEGSSYETTFQMEGTPYEYKVAEISDQERIERILQDKLKKILYYFINHYSEGEMFLQFVLDSMYEQPVKGRCKLIRPTLVRLHLEKFLKAINNIEDFYIRYDEIKNTLQTTMFKEQSFAAIRDYIIINRELLEISKQITYERVSKDGYTNTVYHLESNVIDRKTEKSHTCQQLLSKMYGMCHMYNKETSELDILCEPTISSIKNDMIFPISLGGGGGYYESCGLANNSDFLPLIRKMLSPKAQKIWDKVDPTKRIPLNIGNNKLEQQFPEFFSRVKTDHEYCSSYTSYLNLGTPLMKFRRALLDIDEEFQEMVSQFTCDKDVWHYNGSYNADIDRRIVLPSQKILQDVRDAATDFSKGSEYIKTVLAKHMDDDIGVCPTSMIKTESAARLRQDDDILTIKGKNRSSGTDREGITIRALQESFQTILAESVITGEFNEDAVKTLLQNEFSKYFISEPIQLVRSDDRYSSYGLSEESWKDIGRVIAIDPDSEMFKNYKQTMLEVANDLLAKTKLLESSLLKSDDELFLNWCKDKKLLDGKAVDARITELEEIQVSKTNPHMA